MKSLLSFLFRVTLCYVDHSPYYARLGLPPLPCIWTRHCIHATLTQASSYIHTLPGREREGERGVEWEEMKKGRWRWSVCVREREGCVVGKAAP
jgi:hypothetical protein